MRALLLSLATCTILVTATAAQAGPLPLGSAIRAAAAPVQTTVDPVVYICKQRYWSGKRYCYWRPGGFRWRWRLRWPRWFH